MSASLGAHARGECAGGGAGAAAVCVRDATRADMPHVLRMIQELAAYEGVPDGPQLSAEDLIEDAFDTSPPWCFILVAEQRDAGAGEGRGRLVGYALCNRAYSSWTRRALYVEDLFVLPEMRGQGVGTRLLARLCQIGVSAGVRRIDWHVLESNASARAFYAGLGARCLRETEGRAALRLDQQHIQRLASAAQQQHN